MAFITNFIPSVRGRHQTEQHQTPIHCTLLQLETSPTTCSFSRSLFPITSQAALAGLFPPPPACADPSPLIATAGPASHHLILPQKAFAPTPCLLQLVVASSQQTVLFQMTNPSHIMPNNKLKQFTLYEPSSKYKMKCVQTLNTCLNSLSM